MSNFFLMFIEIVYAVLLYPIGLPGHLRQIPSLKNHLGLSLLLSSLSSSIGVYTLRDYYASNYVSVILFLQFVHMLLFYLWGLLSGSVVDTFIAYKHPDRAGRASQMIAISLFSFLPWIFFLPSAFSIKFISEQTGTALPYLLIPLVLGICLWSMYIVFTGIKYLYEIPARDAVFLEIKTLVTLLIFPSLLAVLFVQEVLQLIQ